MAVDDVESNEIRARIKALRDSAHGLPEIALILDRPPALVWPVISEELAAEDRAG